MPGSFLGRSDRSSNRPRLPLVFGVASSAVLVAIVLFVFWPSDGGASREAARALRQAADAARSKDEPPPGPGEYQYSKTQVSETSVYVAEDPDKTFSFISTSEVETWIGANGSGRKVTEPKGVGWPTPADESAWEAAGSPDLSAERMDDEFEPGVLGVDLSRAPVEPGRLMGAIERREIIDGRATDLVTFRIIGELLHLSYGAPRHRAALFEAAAELTGVEFEGSVTDPTGRPGVSVSFAGDGQRHELIIDTGTGDLLAERVTVLDPQKARAEVPSDAAPGTVVHSAGPPDTVVKWSVFLDIAVVNDTDSRPD
jgi:hypothetical protein